MNRYLHIKEHWYSSLWWQWRGFETGNWFIYVPAASDETYWVIWVLGILKTDNKLIVFLSLIRK